MSGVTKHIYDHEIRDIVEIWNNHIKSIKPIMPQFYIDSDIISALKCYYPHEWDSVNYKYSYYQSKDKYLKRHFGKARFYMIKPEMLLKTVSEYKKMILPEERKTYSNNYSEEERVLAEKKLWIKRKPKIDKINLKIEKALIKTQRMTPAYIDQLIGLYERKNTSQKDRLYIILELKKYYNIKVIQFFFKLIDTELNKQLRDEAFQHLQSFNYQPRIRRQKYMQIHTKNAKRKKFLKDVYSNQTYIIPKNPNELEYRINNSSEQKLKEFDYFISHSSKDSAAVQKLIKAENDQEKNIFCDWINDVDYLKRHLLCTATLKVIEKRLEQSKALIFVSSENSLNSIWCKYELNYFGELNKPMYTIRIENIDNDIFVFEPLESNSYIDSDYKKLALIESTRIFP